MALSMWTSLHGRPLGDGGPVFTVLGGEVVMTELGQFSKSRVQLAASNERAVLAMTPWTLCELVQDDVGTISYGYVLNPAEQITDRDEHTITLELTPLTVECTWRRTRRGWTAATWLSVVAQRLIALVPGWSATYVNPAGDQQVSVTLQNPTVLAAFLSVATQFAQFVRLGVDAAGAPARVLEMGPFGAAPTMWLTGPNGGDAERMRGNDLIRLVATVDRSPNNVEDLVNVLVPLGGGTNDTLVTLERLWRIMNDPTYPNFGRWGSDAQSIAWTGKPSLFPEYDPAYPIADPQQPPGTIPPGDPRYGFYGNRAVTLDGHFDYVVYDAVSYATVGDPAVPGSGHREGEYIDSGLTYADNSVANQELTARALYVAATTQFKRFAHAHHTFACTAEGRGLPTRAGDLIAVDYARVSVDDDGAVVEMDVTENLRVMSVVRTFGGDAPPVDRYTLSNLGRFDDDGTLGPASAARQLPSLQINQGTGLFALSISRADNVDALHPLHLYITVPATLFSWHQCSLRVDFLPYRGTATTGLSPATPITLTVDHGDHNLDGSFNADGTGVTGTTDGFDLVQTGVDNDAVVQLIVSNDGGTQPIGQRLNAELQTNPTRWRLSSGAVPDGTPVGANMKINFTKAKTKSAFTAAIKKAVKTAATLSGLLPPHTHPLDQKIPDGPSPVSCAVAINGQALSSGIKATNGATSPFPASFEIADIEQYLFAPGQTLDLSFTPGTNGQNPYGVGYFQVSGTWIGEIGGLTSTVRAA